jgi:hypothetical protein
MMKLVYKFGLAFLLFALLGLTAQATDGERREFTKVIKKEFDITANGTAAIVNKYGKVDVKTWDRNRVKIDVTIVVNAANEAAAQKVFDRINVNFFNKSNYVKAETVIEPISTSWWSSVATGTTRTDYSINYEVYLPATNNLEVYNRYGDSYVAPMDGAVTMDIRYGNFKMQGVNNTSKISLAYGNGTLVTARNVNSDVSYGKLIIGEMRDGEFLSKYSNLKIDKAENIRCSSKYDNYEVALVREFRNDGKYDNFRITQADNVLVNAQYTQVNISKLQNLLDLNLKYGGATIGIVSKDFSSINLLGSYTDFKLALEANTSFNMEASSNYAGISYPANMTVTYEQNKGTSHEVKGHFGRQDTRSAITARLNYGALKVKQE